jgi:pimeloyl-ACP methyl ester carboxylesterase
VNALSVTVVPCRTGQARALELGEGPAAVVLASPVVPARAYRALLSALAVRHRAVVLALPGYEPRDLPAETVTRVADAAGEALGALGIERALVAGHGLTAPVAVELAARQPGRVAGLVLAAPEAPPRLAAVEVPTLLFGRHAAAGGPDALTVHPVLFARAVASFATRVQLRTS